MELRQLEYFQMVSRLNSVTRAGEQLHIAQPTITVAIQKLEDELGIALFNHCKKRLILTDEGRLFLRHVEHILDNIQNALQEVNDYKQRKNKTIKLGVPPMIGSFLFPQIFSNFQKRYPFLKLSTSQLGGSLTIQTLLEQNKLDLGIVIITTVSPLLDTLPIMKGEVLACLCPDHSLSHLSAIPIHLLNDQPLIMSEEGTYFRQLIVAECKRYNFIPNIILSYNQVETVQSLVAKGTGICFLPDFVVQKYPDIIGRPLSNHLYFEIGLAWNKEKHLSDSAQTFIKFMINQNS